MYTILRKIANAKKESDMHIIPNITRYFHILQEFTE